MNDEDLDWLHWLAEGGAGQFAPRAQAILAELDRRDAAIERVRDFLAQNGLQLPGTEAEFVTKDGVLRALDAEEVSS